MYSKHDDSNSFREHQQQKLLKRQHPVNCADNSSSNLIDVNHMIRDIDENAGKTDVEQDAELAQKSKFHENCTARTHSKVTVASVKAKEKKELPFQRNYLKKAVTKAKNRVISNVVRPKISRYDNFLKSGKRFDGPSKTQTHVQVPSTAFSKPQNLKRFGETSEFGFNSNDENGASAPKTFGGTSTPVETQVKIRQDNYVTGNNAMLVSKSKSRMFSNVTKPNFPPNADFLKSGKIFNLGSVKERAIGTLPSATITKEQYLKQAGEANEVHSDDGEEERENSFNEPPLFDPQEVNHRSLRPLDSAKNSKPVSFQGVSFEDRVLQELSNLKKSQESFETRIENKIQTFINDQQANLQSNRKSSAQGNDQSQIRFQGRQPGRLLQVRHRDPVPHRYVEDLDDYDELDQNFPLNANHHADELEFNIRKNLEFKFLLNSRLNELSGKTYQKCIHLKMGYLFTDTVQECYTWRGTETKKAFKDFKAINNLILGSVRDRFPNTHKDEYKDYMMTWLKHAKSRQRQ